MFEELEELCTFNMITVYILKDYLEPLRRLLYTFNKTIVYLKKIVVNLQQEDICVALRRLLYTFKKTSLYRQED